MLPAIAVVVGAFVVVAGVLTGELTGELMAPAEITATSVSSMKVTNTRQDILKRY